MVACISLRLLPFHVDNVPSQLKTIGNSSCSQTDCFVMTNAIYCTLYQNYTYVQCVMICSDLMTTDRIAPMRIFLLVWMASKHRWLSLIWLASSCRKEAMCNRVTSLKLNTNRSDFVYKTMAQETCKTSLKIIIRLGRHDFIPLG